MTGTPVVTPHAPLTPHVYFFCLSHPSRPQSTSLSPLASSISAPVALRPLLRPGDLAFHVHCPLKPHVPCRFVSFVTSTLQSRRVFCHLFLPITYPSPVASPQSTLQSRRILCHLCSPVASPVPLQSRRLSRCADHRSVCPHHSTSCTSHLYHSLVPPPLDVACTTHLFHLHSTVVAPLPLNRRMHAPLT